jgi:cytochrome c553
MLLRFGCLLALLLLPGPRGWSRDIAAFYAEVCANCHGKNMEGAQAPGLLKAEMFKHGTDDLAIARSIRDGYPTNNMIAWKMVLSEAEIRAMVVFIREKQEKFQKGQISFPKPVDGQIVQSKLEKFRIKNVAEGLKTPWSIAFLPDRRMLVTELSGNLRIVEEGKPLCARAGKAV